jgi:levanase/fructan beta-fructosidase
MKTVIKKIFRLLCCITGMVFVTGCKQSLFDKRSYTESVVSLKLSFHTQKAGWMIPMGCFITMVTITFYQYYPDSNVWGPMHWDML